MRGSGSLVLVLFSASAAVAISNDHIQRDIKTPNIRTPQSQQQQQHTQLPRHLLRTNNNRQLRSDNDKSTIEFCGKCTWQGNISCEARAQYLVRNSPESTNLTLPDARISILETCKSDGSDLSTIPIDAFCGTCQYMKMNFNCNSRVDYLVTTYYLGREKAIESLLKDGNCIDVNWVPPITIDDDNTNDSLSNGAIIGIVIGITILLCCCIGLGSLYYYKRTKQNEQAQASQQLPAGSKRAKASEIRKKVMAEANARNNTEDSPDSSSREEQDVKKKKKKSLSFSPPVVWNITSDDGDKPDPPTQDEILNKETNKKKEIDNTQQVLDMMESALDKTNTNNNDDPPDFRDSTISELSCNIDPPTDDEEEGVVLPSTMDEEQALPNVNPSGQVTNEKQDALAIDNDTRQNEEMEGIVRRISLEP